MCTRSRPKNWIFLGDSLTEGVGLSRVSYVTELARRLRDQPCAAHGSNVHVLRLRQAAPATFNRFVRFNLAGHRDDPPPSEASALWLWNLACEGTTIDTDASWLPLIENLQPDIIFIFRGSLESILRPANLKHGNWPFWVPKSWRGFAALDPRCYFSTTWWRRLKQAGQNALRQRVRHFLLRREAAHPLMDTQAFAASYAKVLEQMSNMSTRVVMLGLLPIDENSFPGSPDQFQRVNTWLRLLAVQSQAEFLDWQPRYAVAMQSQQLSYLDGFHPNQAGARVLADILLESLRAQSSTQRNTD